MSYVADGVCERADVFDISRRWERLTAALHSPVDETQIADIVRILTSLRWHLRHFSTINNITPELFWTFLYSNKLL